MIYLVSGDGRLRRSSRLRGSSRLCGSSWLCGSSRLRGWSRSGGGCERRLKIEILLVNVRDKAIRNLLNSTRGGVVEPPGELLGPTIFARDDARSKHGYRSAIVHISLFKPDTDTVINVDRVVRCRRMLSGVLGVGAGPPSTSGALETKSISSVEATGDKVILVDVIHHNDIRPKALLRQREFEHCRILNAFFLLGILKKTRKFGGGVPWWRARLDGSKARWWIGDESRA